MTIDYRDISSKEGLNNNLREGLCVANEPILGAVQREALGKVLMHRDLHDITEAEQVLLIQHGLPGIKWRQSIDEKARALTATREDIAIILAMTSGVRAGRHSEDTPESREIRRITEHWPRLVEAYFTLERYLSDFNLLTRDIRKMIGDTTKFSMAGHSYGAFSTALAIRKLLNAGQNPPQLLTLLAPFMKVALSNRDPRFKLNIYSRENPKAGDTAQIMRLVQVLRECSLEYHTAEGHGTLFSQHQVQFGQDTISQIGDLGQIPIDVNLVFGAGDEYIGQDHKEAAQAIFGERVKGLQTLEADGHDLASLDLSSLLAK